MMLEITTAPDLLRLATLPVFGYAAWYDHRTRTAPRALWPPLTVFGLLLLPFLGVGLGVLTGIVAIVALAALLHRYRGVGAADAKAMVAVAVLFPTLSPSVLVIALVLALAWPVAWALQGRLEGDVEELTVPFLVPLFAGLLLAVTVGNPLGAMMPP